MKSDLSFSSIHLAKGQLQRIDDGRGVLVQCQHGSLWLTQESDPRDVILEAGAEFTIERNGASYLSALSDASFVLLRDRVPFETAPRFNIRNAMRAVP